MRRLSSIAPVPERPATNSSKAGMQKVFWTSTATRQMRNASSAAGWSPSSSAHPSASCARSSYDTRHTSPTASGSKWGGIGSTASVYEWPGPPTQVDSAPKPADNRGGMDWLLFFRDGIAAWLPLFFAVLLVLMVYILWRTLQVMPRVTAAKTITSDARVSWDDVAGLDEAKNELREVIDFLSDPDRFGRLGARVAKGILLYGPPGTGKTLLAKAIASEAGARFYAQSASAFVEMFAGLGAARIRKLFEEARKNAPSIVFIDELDAVGAQRTGHGFSREQDQTLNQLLVELDGFGVRDQLIVMGASNRLQDLDAALLRPGRFDRQVLVAAPDLAGREEILRVHTRGKPLGEDVDLMSIARQTAGLTGAELENIANEAAIFAGRNGQKALFQADFEDAMERVVAGLQQRKVMTEKERRIVAYHEA